MKLSEFDYNLPEELIAQKPMEPRDHSRLLVLDKKTGEINHHTFYEIVDYLNSGDVLVVNNSKVFSARLFGHRADTGSKVEILLNKNIVLKFQKQATPIKFIWFAGNTSKKPKDLITYSMINSGLASYIVELNRHYSDILEAYYLPTGLISPSTLGDEFIKLLSPEIAKMAQHPRVLAESLQEVIDGRVKPGMMAIKKDII